MLMSRVAILLICACLSLVSYADSKPNLVLLPLDVSESEMNLVSEFGSALHQGLQDRYTVFFGAAVERELDKEYSKLDCTAESCNQNVAIAFNGELVGDGSVKRVGNGYILKLVIQNVLTNEIIETQTIPCSTCDAFQVITQLKEIGSGKALESNNASVTTRVSETGVNQGQVNRIGTSPTTAVKNSKAILVFDSEPSGAEVWLDGSKIGKTPFQGTDFVKGETYRITLKEDRFTPYIFDLTVTESIVYLPPVTLEPGFGDVIILTETYMPGARVYIDGKAHGNAPYQGKFAAGPHQIYVMNDQKQSLISEVMVKTDQLHEVIVTFNPNQGHTSAQNDLGNMYGEGLGVPQDDVEAAKWYRQAAEQGHASAQNNLGNMYRDGLGVPQDDVEAAKWYRLAAEQGQLEAIFYITNTATQAVLGVKFSEEANLRYLKLAENKLRSTPDNIEDLWSLGSAYMNHSRFSDAVTAYAKALAALDRMPEVYAEDRAALMTYVVQARFFANERALAPIDVAYLEEAIQLDPMNSLAVGIRGIAAYEAGDYTTAIVQWRRLAEISPAEASSVRSAIASAEAKLVELGVAIPEAATPAVQADAESAGQMNEAGSHNMGKVVEFTNVPGYTYALINTNDGDKWFAGPSADIYTGQTVYWNEGAMMSNFNSRAVGRTFDALTFIDNYMDAPASLPSADMRDGSAGPAAGASAQQGRILSAQTSAGYLYLEVETDNGDIWLASPAKDLREGDMISWADSTKMSSFTAKSLGLTFETIYFVSSIKKF